MSGTIRPYSEKKDKKAVHRIWTECGWISDSKDEKASLDLFLASNRSMVYEYRGEAECLVTSTPGKLRYLDADIDYSAITAVTTSRIARNLGAASSTLARVIAQDAKAGAVVSGLGVFEQGFYNRLGFGSGTYVHWIGFDPAWLVPLPKPAVPLRLDRSHWKSIHQSRLRRRKLHGAVDLLPPEISKTEMLELKNTFGLGYKKNGKITHCVIMHADNVEEGPYHVAWMSYENLQQFQELLSLIAGLGDQVRQVRMREPLEIQMQDFIRKPFQLLSLTRKGNFEAGLKAYAYWQMRILDLKRCVAAMSCDGEMKINLVIDDPILQFLPKGTVWKGCKGEYTLSLGVKSSLKKGLTGGLKTLRASIGDFTRFWMGIQSAEVLNISGVFEGSLELLNSLDRIYQIPVPEPDWEY